MTTLQIRRRVKRRVDTLSEDRLRVADELLARLEEQESIDATEELLATPGILDRLKRAEKQIAAGKTVPVSRLRRKP